MTNETMEGNQTQAEAIPAYELQPGDKFKYKSTNPDWEYIVYKRLKNKTNPEHEEIRFARIVKTIEGGIRYERRPATDVINRIAISKKRDSCHWDQMVLRTSRNQDIPDTERIVVL
jgi:hypothetical protein